MYVLPLIFYFDLEEAQIYSRATRVLDRYKRFDGF